LKPRRANVFGSFFKKNNTLNQRYNELTHRGLIFFVRNTVSIKH
jgi:hypothetical protein